MFRQSSFVAKTAVAVIAIGLVLPFFNINTAYANKISTGACEESKLIYAQDVEGITPGSNNDTAIINDRDGTRLKKQNQVKDDYVIWSSNVDVRVFKGESFVYKGSGSKHSLTFDILDNNRQFIERISSNNRSKFTTSINQDGYIRFKEGKVARESNVLVLCPKVENTTNNTNNSTPNRPPVWIAMPDQYGYTSQYLQFYVTATDSDNDFLTYQSFNLPSGASFNSSSRLFSWTPQTAGNYTITFRVSDGVYTADMNVIIRINNYNQSSPPYYPPYYPPTYYNRPPVWVTSSIQYGYVGQYLQFTVTATDPDNDYLTYQVLNLSSGAAFNSNTKVFSWTPQSAGDYFVTFRVSDGNNYSDMNVDIRVSGSPTPYIPPIQPPAYNQPPTIISFNPPTIATEGQVYTYTIQAQDPENSKITYRIIDGPQGLSVHSEFGIILWVPNFIQGRSDPYLVSVGISDGINEIVRNYFITVRDVAFTTPAPVPAPTPTPPPAPAPAPISTSLEILNLSLERRDGGDVVVHWETNKPATSRVVYDTISQAERDKDFTYVSSTEEDGIRSIVHVVNLGVLDANRNYYLRAISRSGIETAISNELGFVQLEVEGGMNLAAFMGALGGFLTNRWLLLILVIILAILLWRNYRKNNALLIKPEEMK